ncbi:P-loop containing nucleoside triphosphate hydrolase protein [Irpex rosettiformis]|uniref:P-loop containing nucleoside triphosphate hydrolase protein n=1 Tax=Irpex rosettiformis TaxID=378272 RepID=A0ACB8U439_9APHY|nr:P-loop containing nucleoside triphosphate hydrolase protein [Irpex rosettiformis]
MPDGAKGARSGGVASGGISASDYAARTRRLIRLIKDLRALGADSELNLPRIAVIGNQSAGKSSLVEAISQITVPRASGTCTRCPMECRMTFDEFGPWQCQILIRRETDADGNNIPVKEDKFGGVLYDKSELEEMLRRAQLAILNPSLPADSLLDFDTSALEPGERPPGSDRQLQFSNNVVCLDISGPDVIDLAFIDLPGIISYVGEGEDPNNIKAVQDMVTRHIQGNTLILLTITMRDDIDNQGAARFAREADPDGMRTIGVLTKPDTIQQGEAESWLRVLNGSRHALKHGYYMTKQPSPQELDEKVSYETARQREVAFFGNTSPWNVQSHLRQRMGTENLTKELSKLLGSLINKALPQLRKDSKNSYAKIEKLLADLPPPPSDDPASDLLRMVTSFSHQVGSLIEGEEAFERLLQRCRPAYLRLKHDIRGTAPRFMPFMKNEDTKGFDVDWKIEPDVSVLEEGDEGCRELSEVMHLDDVKKHIEKSLTRELPFNVPFKAKVSLIQRFFADWDEHCLRCFDDVSDACAEELKALINAHFGEYTALLDSVDVTVEELSGRRKKETKNRIQWMLALENPPFTNNTHYFIEYRQKYLDRYKEARQPPDDTAGLEQLLKSLKDMGREDVKKGNAARFLTGSDAHEEELIVMAETAAYFHVAYKRIIDNIPRIIDHDFLKSIASEMQKTLMSGLGLAGDDGFQIASRYLAEDDDMAVRRKDLKNKKERIRGVMDKLYRFGV